MIEHQQNTTSNRRQIKKTEDTSLEEKMRLVNKERVPVVRQCSQRASVKLPTNRALTFTSCATLDEGHDVIGSCEMRRGTARYNIFVGFDVNS